MMVPMRAWLLAALAWALVVGEAHGSTSTAQDDCEDDGGDRKSMGITDNIMTQTGVTVDRVLRPALLNRGTTFGALILVCFLHGLRWFGFSDWPNWRTFLVHCIVLNIFYSVRSPTVVVDSMFHRHCPFLLATAFLVIDSIAHGVMHARSESKKRDTSLAPEPRVVSRYMQVASPFTHATLVFLGQFCLMMLFIFALNRDKETKQACNVSFTKWVVASIITIIAGQAEVGMEYDPRFWNKLLLTEQAQREGRILCDLRVPNSVAWKVRWAYSFIVNNVFRMLVLGLCPIMLCVSDSMEFIKDCLALFFITKLDDVADGRTLAQELDLWQTRENQRYDLMCDPDEEDPLAGQSAIGLGMTTGASREEAEARHEDGRKDDD